ncbi:MAG: hypothetical protein QOF14_2670 [Hyphomicrobiales bacterium]|nr:hypothetical protein [Hyphomicrobiales bacterium]
MQNKKFRSGTRRNRVGAPLTITELDKNSRFVQRLHDRANLSARQTLGWQIGQ